jgi:hypothetical protein
MKGVEILEDIKFLLHQLQLQDWAQDNKDAKKIE